MVIGDLVGILDAKVLTGEENFHLPVKSACGSDLMSDVLAFGQDKSLLITGLVNTQVVRTAEMLDITCLIFSRGKNPSQEVIDLAKECGVTVMTTMHTMYVTCGILYAHGVPGSTQKTGA